MHLPALADAVAVHLGRFLVVLVTLELSGALGVSGWYLGLVANAAATGYAVALVTRRRLWRAIGATTVWRSWAAALTALPLLAEALSWAVPGGLSDRDPGLGLWVLTLLLVGLNEELTSRGVVLSGLLTRYRPAAAVTLTAALFGLQHLSALALTDRRLGDVLANVGLSAVAGFAWAAWQWRFRWIGVLVGVHALADLTTLLAVEPLPDAAVAVAHVGLLGFGVLLLRGRLAGQNVMPSATPPSR
ncbi:CPBP family glutamic-type intramembrane protease [Modestobacter sp. SYSU DS0290]